MLRRTTASRNRHRGFTLLELLVVIAILAILAGMIIPQFGSTTERSQAGAASSNLADLTRAIEQYRATHGAYPDGWDSLIVGTTDGTTVTAGTTSYSKLSTPLKAMIIPAAPTVAQAAALKNAGLAHVNYHDASFTGRPSDSGILAAHIVGHDDSATSGFLAKLDVSTASSPAYLLLTSTAGVPGFNIPVSSNQAGAVDVTDFDFFAFGVGPKHWMVSENLVSAPMIDVHDVGRYYSRGIALFAVPKSPSSTDKARLVGVVGPDGQNADMYLASYYQQSARDH